MKTSNGMHWVSIVVTGFRIKRDATCARRDRAGYE